MKLAHHENDPPLAGGWVLMSSPEYKHDFEKENIILCGKTNVVISECDIAFLKYLGNICQHAHLIRHARKFMFKKCSYFEI